MRMKNLIGQRFGRLVVIKHEGSYISPKNSKSTKWLCKCDCGKEIVAIGKNLRKGKTKSCGCLWHELSKMGSFGKKHSLSKTRLYRTWNAIKRRCNEKRYRAYMQYGGRGIKICDEWLQDFMNFYNWAMANGYREDLTIDRINVNGNYEPNNCRWITIQEQANNRRTNIQIQYKGQKKTLKEWCKILNLKYPTILYRIRKAHYTIEQAFEGMDKQTNENKNRALWDV